MADTEWKWTLERKDGTLLTGWQQVNNKWYYLNPNGTMATGWINIESNWYYLDSAGAMQTGWLKDKEKWYYLESTSNGLKGSMYCNGTYTIDGVSYTFSSSGEWIQYLVTKEQLQKVGWKNIGYLVLKDLNSCLDKFNINTLM